MVNTSNRRSSVPRFRSDALQSRDREQSTKTSLEIEKLELEIDSLRHENSDRKSFTERMKAASGPIAVLGLVVSTMTAFWQVRIATANNREDRFQKQIAHLASDKINERQVGAEGLTLILTDPTDQSHHPDAASFLVDALAVETDPMVRGTLVDAIKRLNPARSGDAKILSEAVLPRLVARNAALAQAQLFTPEQLTADGIATDAHLGPLNDTGKLIADLVRGGIALNTTAGFAGIACIGCDFSNARALKGVNLSGAILADSNFRHADLEKTNFRNSVLVGVDFFGADLRDADLSEEPPNRFEDKRQVLWNDVAKRVGNPHQFGNSLLPCFASAQLQRAKLVGRSLIAMYSNGREFHYVHFEKANLEGADLRNFGAYYVVYSPAENQEALASIPLQFEPDSHPADFDSPKDDPQFLVVHADVGNWQLTENAKGMALQRLAQFAEGLAQANNTVSATMSSALQDFIKAHPTSRKPRCSPEETAQD